MRLALVLITILLLLLTPKPAFAWGYKEHIQLTRLAMTRIVQDPTTPEGLRRWARENCAILPDIAAERDWFMHESVGEDPSKYRGILWWACMPDLQVKLMPRDAKLAYMPAHERLMHYIDLEMFLPEGVVQKYRDDLTARVSPERIPRDANDPRYQQAGFLPLALEHSYREFVMALKENRLGPNPADSHNDDQNDNHALRWAGYLAHYIQDNTQPHHATEDYKSKSYFPGVANPPNVHSEIEWRMGDDPKNSYTALRRVYWEQLDLALRASSNPSINDDLFLSTLEVAGRSYEALPLIGRAAQQANKTGTFDLEVFYNFEGNVGETKMTVLQLKARQQAWAILRTEQLIRKAWDEAKKP